MYSKKFIIFRYYFNYLVLVLIFKGIHLILPISFDRFDAFPLIYIPIAYLVVNNIFIKSLAKLGLSKGEYLVPIIVGFSLINLLLAMPLIYDICIVVMLIILKDKNSSSKTETLKNIADYYKNH